MSQPTTGDRGEGFPSIVHGQLYPTVQGPSDYSNFFPSGQSRSAYAQNGNYFPVKPTNPHMVTGMRPPIQMHTGPVNPMQDVNVHHQQTAHPQFIAGIHYGRSQDFNPHHQHMQNNQYFHLPSQQQQYQYFPNSPNFQISHVMPNQVNTNAFQQAPQNVKYEMPNQTNTYYNSVNTCTVDPAMQEVEMTTPESKAVKYEGSVNSSPANDSSMSACNTSVETDVSVTECFANTAKVNNSYNTFHGVSPNIPNAGNPSANRPRANSRCDSTRSEAAESTCSSLSTESLNENAQNHGQFHLYSNTYGNPYMNSHCYPGGQIQAVHNLNDSDTNNNMSYQSNSSGYSRVNTVINKGSNAADPNLAQNFQQVDTVQQVQMQRGQLQVMQTQYQYMHGHNAGGHRPTMAINPMQAGSNNPNITGNVMAAQGINNVCNLPNYCVVNQQNQFNGHRTFPSPGRMPNMPQHNMMRVPYIQSCPPQMMRMPQAAYHTHCEQRFVPPSGAKFSLPPAIIVPFGWKRINNNGQVVYISPSGFNLHSVPQVVEYLTQEGTCKCGLQCPLRIETSFSFDPKVPHRAMMPSELALNEAELCNHRRKLALSFDVQKQVKKEDGRKKRKRKVKNEEAAPCADIASGTEKFLTAVQNPHVGPHVDSHLQHGQHTVPHSNWNAGMAMQNPVSNYKAADCMHGPSGETSASPIYPQHGQCCSNPQQACGPNKFYPNPNYMQRSECVSNDQQSIPQINRPYPGHCPPSSYYQPQMGLPAPPKVASVPLDSMACPSSSPSPIAEPFDKKKKTTGRAKKRRKIENGTSVPEATTVGQVCKTPDKNILGNCYLGQPSCSSGNGGPSFMEDPNGYLAQQTALLNNTMSGGGVGQFSPQGPGKCPGTFTKKQPVSATTDVGSAAPVPPKSMPSPAVVPLPSNVPLPARVSKGMTSVSNTSVSSKSQFVSQAPSTTSVQTIIADSCSSFTYQTKPSADAGDTSPISMGDGSKSSVATVESSCASHIVTVTYTSSPASTSICKSDAVAQSVFSSAPNSITSTSIKDSSPHVSSSKITDPAASREKSTNSGISASGICSKLLDSDEANRPLNPGTFSSTMNTQSPLEMVQNIVSSIPVPASVKETLPTSRPSVTSQYKPLTSEGGQTTSHHVVAPQIFNVSGNGNVTSVMYNTAGIIRAPTPLVVQGSNQSPLPSGMLVSSSGGGGNVMVVTAPFNAKGPAAGPTACSTVSGVGSVVGIQGVSQVQVQPSLGQVQPHHFQPHMPQIQPVVQLVNTFATMQAPVIIQNGSNILQQTPGVISNQSGVLCPNNIIPTSAATFVASQPILPATTISVGSSQTTPVMKMVSPNSEDGEQGISSNRLTPVQSQGGSGPTTPFSTPGSSGSDTPSSSSGGAGGRRRKKRNSAAAQVPHHPPNIMPAIIMGKQIQQPIVMNSAQIPQMSPYGAMTVPQVATVAAVGNTSAPSDNSHILHSAAHRNNAINVVQMVSGPVAGTLPVQVQQAPAIIVPSAATSGFIINQLSDGSFVSTDPHTGMSYPVQIQLSGSHIVGVTPLAPANANTGVLGQFAAPTAAAGTMVAVNAVRGTQQRATTETKLVNFSPAAAAPHPGINMYNVPTNISPRAANSATQFISSEQNNSLQQLTTASNATVVQQKTTIVAQQTTVVATQGCLSGTHSSVSTQTPGALGESDVTSSDNTGMDPVMSREASTSPSHQSAEISTTRQDEETMSSPDCQSSTPPQKMNLAPDAKLAENTQQFVSDVPTISVVYGQHRGHSKWPGQVLNQVGGRAIIQWFGDRVVESVLSGCLSKSRPCINTITRSRFREKNALLSALAETDSAAGRITYSSAVLANPCIPDLNHNQILTEPFKPKRKRRTR